MAFSLSLLLAKSRKAHHHAQREECDERYVHKHERERSSAMRCVLHVFHSISVAGLAGVYGRAFYCLVIIDALMCSIYNKLFFHNQVVTQESGSYSVSR